MKVPDEQQFSRVEKWDYYSRRMNDKTLTYGQREFARKRVDEIQSLWAKDEAARKSTSWQLFKNKK